MGKEQPLRSNDPRQLGQYRLTGRLGSGGMGIVYAGVSGDGRPVAVKVIHPHLAEAAEFRTRFRSEATLAARVARFSTAAVLHVDVDGEQPFLVTEFVDGPTLQEVVDEQGPLDGGALDQLAIGIVTALTAIHEAGIIHRDLKPSNVILSRFGPRVIDFGIARAADVVSGLTTGAIGSPPYMAPEQFRGEPVTAATDVYAWGAAVCFAGTGRPPFGVGPPEVMLFKTLESEPNLEGLDPALRNLVAAALRKDPARRPRTAEILSGLTLRRPDSPPLSSLPGAVAATDPTVEVAVPELPPPAPGGGERPAVVRRIASEKATRVEESGRPRRRVVLGTAAAAVVAAVLAAAVVLWAGRSTDAPDAIRASPTGPVETAVRQFAADDSAVGPARAVEGARRGGTAVVYAAARYWELDPALNHFGDGMMASSRLLARTLTAYRQSPTTSPTLVGDLATDTGRSTDGGQTWEFTIRGDATFADGTLVTAVDVARGIARSFGPGMTGPSYLQQWLAGTPDFRTFYAGPTADRPYPPGVEPLDARTLRLRFPAAHPDLPSVAALPVTAAVPLGWKPTVRNPLPVTGPYRVSGSYRAGGDLTLVRNPAWRAKSDPVRTDYPDRYVVHFGRSRPDVTRLMMADEDPRGIQLSTVDSALAGQVVGTDRIVDGPGAGHRDLCFNTQRVPSAERRRALSLAFNPESALDAMGGPYVGELTTSLLSPRLPGYPEDQSRARRSGDPAAARAALHGEAVTLVFAYRANSEGKRLADAVGSAFLRAGVTVRPVAVPSDQYLAAIGAWSNPYDLYLCEWAPDYLDGNAMLPLLYSSTGARAVGSTNFSYLREPVTNSELKRIALMPDRKRAAAEYAALALRIRRLAPAIPFFDQRRLALRGSKVQGLFVSSLWAVPDLAQVWVT
ncbi:protein kinase domain-containing protein [Cryptosporangium phraense]|uniref:Protein kinase n=1 Tax=Cryptosporangium phraense TaxID=2593070 RepID=A0A545AHI5_9ACTN|nr:ABC transporter substrate-binding protein [Cryptosporangium phraense]TQS40792.1 protein kinase [Cryptosporangium phraense]